MFKPLSVRSDDREREAHYNTVQARIAALIEDELDEIAILATVACELHHAFGYYDWTGFYRLIDPQELVIGPYQGGHGCLRIHLSRGVCGAAARTRTTQLVPDVSAFPGHIACSSTTRSEIVVPILIGRRVWGVLDVDSDTPAAFTEVDQEHLERLCAMLGNLLAD